MSFVSPVVPSWSGGRIVRAAVVLSLASSGGCVHRVLHVRSDPPGAAVWLNDREVGRTPFDREFLWYGNYDVVARADGRRTVKTTREVNAPWWQFVPFDLVTDFLPVTDDQTIDVVLPPQFPPDPAGTLARGEAMRQRLEGSEHTVHKAVLSVRPATTRAATTRAVELIPATPS